MFEMINSQLYYADHLPRLTNLNKKSKTKQLEAMMNHFAFDSISYKEKN